MSVFFPLPDVDDRVPSLERQDELRTHAAENRAAGKPPYEGVWIKTRGEWAWVMTENGWPAAGSEEEHADFRGVSFNSANLSGVSLQCADLRGADLTAAGLGKTWSSYANFAGARLGAANMEDSLFAGANFTDSLIDRAKLARANLMNANLCGANLLLADLSHSYCAQVDLSGANLQLANLKGARLENVNLRGANLREALMDAETKLTGSAIDDATQVADTVWNGVPLTRVSWDKALVLGDELAARQFTDDRGKPKDETTLLAGYDEAVRANRQLANALQAQGLNEYAANYAYRAQRLRRLMLRRQALHCEKGQPWRLKHRARNFIGFVWSLFLDVIAGYGYRPGRSVIAYLLVIFVFASAYFAFGPSQGVPLSPLGALVFSVTSFHGRGFFPGGSPGHNLTLDDPLTVLAAGEAVLGLIIEVSFIATFTQRFFGNTVSRHTVVERRHDTTHLA